MNSYPMKMYQVSPLDSRLSLGHRSKRGCVPQFEECGLNSSRRRSKGLNNCSGDTLALTQCKGVSFPTGGVPGSLSARSSRGERGCAVEETRSSPNGPLF